jgi:3-oxoadipate enol-lactonase
MGGNHLSWWQQVPSFVSAGYRALTFDHRGFGRSSCPAGEFHPARFPADLLAILDDAGIERTALVCQSMGGWTGLPTAVKSPERVSALLLCGTPGGLALPEVAAARQQLAAQLGDGPPRGNAALAPDYPDRQPEMAFLYDQLSALNPGLAPEALATFGDPTASVDPASLSGYATPTLVIAGTEDQLFPLPVLQATAAAIPGAEIVEFPGVGHSTYFEDAARFTSLAGEFVAKHSRGQGR